MKETKETDSETLTRVRKEAYEELKTMFPGFDIDGNYLDRSNLIDLVALKFLKERLSILLPTEEEIPADDFLDSYKPLENDELSWQSAEECFKAGVKATLLKLKGE